MPTCEPFNSVINRT